MRGGEQISLTSQHRSACHIRQIITIAAAATATTSRPHTEERSPRPPSPSALPHVPLVKSAHPARTAQSVQQFNTRSRPLIGFWTISSRENLSKPRATDVCSFTSSASCFLFLSLPFLSHSFYSPSLFLCLNWVGASSFLLLPGFAAGPVRSVLLCLPLIFVMYIDNYKRKELLCPNQIISNVHIRILV